MKKTMCFLMALALVLGLTQCKKEKPQTQGVRITLDVDGGNSKVDVNPTGGGTYATVTFQNGDIIYVGNNGSYCGYLQHNGTHFTGSINDASLSEGDYLHFYFMGNKGTTSQPSSVNITDQTSEYPVISYAHSTVKYTSGITHYSAKLQNYCAIVKFTTTDIDADITITGMKNTVTVDFAANNAATSTTGNPYSFSKDGDGNITLHRQSNTARWAILLPQDEVTTATATATGYASEGTFTVPGITANMYSNTGVNISMTAVWDGDLAHITSESTEAFATATDGMTITGTLGVNKKISIADGATVTLDGVTINGTKSNSYQWAGITCLGDATIILSGTNTVKGFYGDYPGIHVPAGSKLTIQGSTGSLNASSNGYGAGIGGGWEIDCGNIEIQGGTITATGGVEAAGIGSGGDGASCGTITISGGTVTATGGVEAAGIGSGTTSSCGNITITSGVTSVTAIKGDDATYSIGAGEGGTCGTVTIGGVETGPISTSPYTYPAPVVPSGAIDGKFSVSSTKQVYFSQGNLQYQASTGTWRFAEHQYDFIGGGNFLSESNPEWIDLYRWGTSGIDYTGHATLYRPWDFAYYSVYFNPYGSLTTNLYDGAGENAGKADWGYNAISNGGNTQNSGWRTLKNNTTDNEWQYIFNTRTTANEINSTSNARYTQARINIDDWAVKGIILFPDGSIGDTPSGVTWGTINAAASSWTTGTTQCTTAGWAALEAAGCVFLPASGKYDDSGVGGAEIDGYYWSSSYANDDNAYGMYFYSNEVNPQYSDARHYGLSVRLVKDAN